MSGLRQRREPNGAPVPPSSSRRAGGPPKRPTRNIHLALTAIILAFFVIYSQRQKQAPYTVDGIKKAKPLPEWYAVCSKEGKKVYTVPVDGDDAGGVECVVVGGKVVVDTGSLAKIRRRWGEKGSRAPESGESTDSIPAKVHKSGIQIIYLPPGHSLTPGLTDAHAHPLEYGYSRRLPLAGTKSVEEVITGVEEYVASRADKIRNGEWIIGMGWDQTKWPVQELPSAADLDKSPVLRGLPIVLYRIDIHAAWVSPAVLKIMGTLPDKDEEGGKVVRDENGNPTGLFIDNAMRWHINPIMPPITDEHRAEALEIVTRDALSLGMTGMHDAGQNPVELDFFKRMAAEEKLRMRFYTMLLCVDRAKFCGDAVERVTGLQDGRFTLQSIKLMADGALGSRGAALLEDYADQPGWKGFLLTEESEWAPLIKRYYDDGWQVNVHCIGDRANHVVLNGFEAAIGVDKEAGRARRLRIEHAQIFTQEDLKRGAEMGIIASYQPTHATSDMWYAEDRLGPERIKGAYAWRSYLSHGGRIALGSDFPVESPDPLKGFYAAVTRRGEDGRSPHGPGGWYPSEKLSRLEALRGFTVDPAYAAFSNDTGSFRPGMRFDAVLWDDDLMTVDEDEMLDVKVKATIIDGRIVYGQWKA